MCGMDFSILTTIYCYSFSTFSYLLDFFSNVLICARYAHLKQVDSPPHSIINVYQPLLVSRLINPVQTLIEEREARVLVGNKRPFFNEPTECLHLHQVCIKLVVRLVAALQKP